MGEIVALKTRKISAKSGATEDFTVPADAPFSYLRRYAPDYLPPRENAPTSRPVKWRRSNRLNMAKIRPT